MKSLRLIPIVLVAVTALLLLKGIGLLTQGGYTLLGTEFAHAQDQGQTSESVESPVARVQTSDAEANVELSTIEEAAAQRAADSLFSNSNSPIPDNGQEDAVPTIENSDGQQAAFSTEDGGSLTEQAILQRLSDRRAELDSRETALELQAGLVAAAEIRLNERIANLEALEVRVQALVDQQNDQGNQQFDALVSMYANMKSSDAATLFNSLNMDILLRLATKMSPRKMSPILADMNVERAQQLTVRMAMAQMSSLSNIALAEAEPMPTGMEELPQIVGQ